MRLLITGGAGFIGSTLADRALEAGHEVVVIDDLSTGYRDNVPEHVRFIEGSVLQPGALAEAMDGVDAVVHLPLVLPLIGLLARAPWTDLGSLLSSPVVADALRGRSLAALPTRSQPTRPMPPEPCGSWRLRAP